MIWIILWLALSVVVTLFIGAFIAVGNRRPADWESTDHLMPEMHDQTIVG